MDIIIGLFFLWIIFNIFSGFAKISKQQSKATPSKTSRRDASPQTVMSGDVRESQEFEDLQSRVKTISKQQAVQFARKAAMKRQRDRKGGTDIPIINPSKNRDMQDKNINRREDWGSRAGPGLLSTANILIFIAFALVVMLLIQFLSLL